MLTLTPSAKAAIERLLDEPKVPEGAGVRIAPKEPASNGMAGHDLRLSVAREPDASDEVIEDEGARVFLDDAVTAFLADKQLDAEVVDERVGFVIAEQP
ncbi:MAG: HesB/YadR/YfhF-family protein [Solirubrobacteraceae bacterium]